MRQHDVERCFHRNRSLDSSTFKKARLQHTSRVFHPQPYCPLTVLQQHRHSEAPYGISIMIERICLHAYPMLWPLRALIIQIRSIGVDPHTLHYFICFSSAQISHLWRCVRWSLSQSYALIYTLILIAQNLNFIAVITLNLHSIKFPNKINSFKNNVITFL